jgi:Family of unknown function (DUF6226)
VSESVKPYERPVIEERVFRDDFGVVIPYGSSQIVRSHSESERTNVFSHQERYLPIFTVARALLEYLTENFEVEIVEESGFHGEFEQMRLFPTITFERVIKVQPELSTQPLIWIGFGAQPGQLKVAAGVFASFDLWFCGCDSCDDRWQDVAEGLESVVLGIARSGFTEKVDRGRWGRARYWLDPTRPKRSAGSIPKSMVRADLLASATTTLATLPGGAWAGFTPR